MQLFQLLGDGEVWALGAGNPWWEFVIRAAIVFAFLFVLLRISGQRQIGQMTPFDLVLLLILSNAVQNSMNAGDNSVTAGFILAATLVAINYAIGWLAFKNKTVERLLEGRPKILVHDGQIDHAMLRELQMTQHELREALRAEGHVGLQQVRYAVLETTGRVSVIAQRSDNNET